MRINDWRFVSRSLAERRPYGLARLRSRSAWFRHLAIIKPPALHALSLGDQKIIMTVGIYTLNVRRLRVLNVRELGADATWVNHTRVHWSNSSHGLHPWSFVFGALHRFFQVRHRCDWVPVVVEVAWGSMSNVFRFASASVSPHSEFFPKVLGHLLEIKIVFVWANFKLI